MYALVCTLGERMRTSCVRMGISIRRRILIYYIHLHHSKYQLLLPLHMYAYLTIDTFHRLKVYDLDFRKNF